MASIRDIKIDSTTYDIKATHYATCPTAATTTEKVATVQNGSFTLEAGSRVAIKFTYENSVASAVLNVNSTGAKEIYWKGTALQSTQYWVAGQVVDFIYDGSYWHMISTGKDDLFWEHF